MVVRSLFDFLDLFRLFELRFMLFNVLYVIINVKLWDWLKVICKILLINKIDFYLNYWFKYK